MVTAPVVVFTLSSLLEIIFIDEGSIGHTYLYRVVNRLLYLITAQAWAM
jgi:hypothetical protein